MSAEKKSLNEEYEETVDGEQFSDHKSNSKKEWDSINELYISKFPIIILAKDGITKWNKKEIRWNVKTLTHNILRKLYNFLDFLLRKSVQWLKGLVCTFLWQN